MTGSFVPTLRRSVAVVVLAAVPCLGCAGGDAPDSSDSSDSSESGVSTQASPAPTDAVPMAADVDGPYRGMMTYMADAPRFADCATGRSYVMAQEADYLAAERAYLDAEAQGEPLLVTFQGRLARRPGMEGGEVDAVLVTAFGEAHPGQGCDGDPVVGGLEGTEWQLVSLPGGVDVPPGVAATLLLDPDMHRALGSTGCNRFTGSYELEGGRLTLGLTALTRMACPDPLGGVEADFLEALRLTGSYRFAGGLLELLGEAGAVARFAGPDALASAFAPPPRQAMGKAGGHRRKGRAGNLAAGTPHLQP